MAARLMEPTRQATGRVLLEAAAIGERELKKQIDMPKLDAELKTATTTILQPLQEALRFQSNGAQSYGDVQESVHLLAMRYVTLGEKNVSTAVERAANDIILKDFTFRGSYFIPKEVDAATVDRGVAAALRDVAKQKVMLPTDTIGLRPEDIRTGAVDALQAGGVWVTNDAGTGVVLTWPNARRERVLVESNGKSRPLEYTWDDLKALTVTAPRETFNRTPGGAATGRAK
jgi:hypothetical protein